MAKYTMMCSCGDPITVEADSLDAAKQTIKGMMSEEEIVKHMAEKHAGQPVPSKADVDAMIDKDTHEVTEEAQA